MATKKKQPTQRLVQSTFTVTLVEYVTHEASPTKASELEEVVSDNITSAFNGTCMVAAVGKPSIIAKVV